MADETFKNVDEITEPKQEEQKQKEENKRETKKEKKVEQKQISKKQSKKAVKKSKTKQVKEHKSKTPDWVIITLSAILVVALVIGAYFIFLNMTPESEQDSVAAIVNGAPIYESEVAIRLNMIRSMNDPTIDRNTTLSVMIDELLLYQEAQTRGYKTTSSEVDTYISEILFMSGIDEQNFEKDLKTAGIDIKDLKEVYLKTLTVHKLLNSSVISQISISDQEINKFYEENKEDLSLPERVTVKHILISLNATATAEEVKELLLDDKSNFCDLVEEYSADYESIITCGEYTFTRLDPMVEEFLEASFEMNEGEVKIVQTLFGEHIIYKIKSIPEGTPAVSELKDEITDYLKNQKIMSEYTLLLNDLRDKAIIELYTNQTNDTAKLDNSSQPVKELVKTEESSKLNLAKCLSEKGAKLYKVYWCPHCEEQVKDFGEYGSELAVVECDPEGENPQVAECQATGIRALPTWIINGQKYEGRQSLQKLAEYSGCAY